MDSYHPTGKVSGLTLRQAALVCGLAYLLNPVTFAEYYAMPSIVVAEPARTLANLQAHPHLDSAGVMRTSRNWSETLSWRRGLMCFFPY